MVDIYIQETFKKQTSPVCNMDEPLWTEHVCMLKACDVCRKQNYAVLCTYVQSTLVKFHMVLFFDHVFLCGIPWDLCVFLYQFHMVFFINTIWI